MARGPEDQDLTQLLQQWSDGDKAALDELAPIVHAELHRIARSYMARERAGHTLQTTALVNEAFIRLIKWKNAEWNSRAHFFGVAANIMRRVLVDFARKRPRSDGNDLIRVSIGRLEDSGKDSDPEILALDDALNSLAEFDPRKARIVELRFFGGLSVDETAEVIGVSAITVMREWKKAKAWLYLQLNNQD